MAKLLAHKMLGLAIAYYTLRPTTFVQAVAYGGLALIGSVIPDLDGLHRHRMTLHNMFSCLITTAIVYTILLVVNQYRLLPISIDVIGSAMAYLLAYLSHLVADIPTGHGVALLYPVSRRRLSILGLRYDSIVYNGLLVALATWLLYSYFTSVATAPF